MVAGTISSLVRNFSVLLKHMSPGSLWGAAASATLEAGISLLPILQVGYWARVSTPVRHLFFHLYHYY